MNPHDFFPVWIPWNFAPKIILERVSLAPSIIQGCTSIEFFGKGLGEWDTHACKKCLEKVQEQVASGRNSTQKRNKSQKAMDYEVIDSGMSNFFYADWSFINLCKHHVRHCTDVYAKDLQLVTLNLPYWDFFQIHEPTRHFNPRTTDARASAAHAHPRGHKSTRPQTHDTHVPTFM